MRVRGARMADGHDPPRAGPSNCRGAADLAGRPRSPPPCASLCLLHTGPEAPSSSARWHTPQTVSSMVISTVFGLWPAISTASLFMPDPWRACLLSRTSRQEHPVSVGPAAAQALSTERAAAAVHPWFNELDGGLARTGRPGHPCRCREAPRPCLVNGPGTSHDRSWGTQASLVAAGADPRGADVGAGPRASWGGRSTPATTPGAGRCGWCPSRGARRS
jgi:hypothetical protein